MIDKKKIIEEVLDIEEVVIQRFEAQLKDDIEYFKKLKRNDPKNIVMKEYCRGRIDEAKYLLDKLEEV